MKRTQEFIGNVKLEYKFYRCDDLYSDGDEIEEQLLYICKKGAIEEELLNGKEWPLLYHLSDIRENILEWYPIEKTQSVLEIGSGCGAITGILSEKAQKVTCVELSRRRSLINANRNKNCNNVEIIVGNFEDIEFTEKYDFITLIGVFEYAAHYISGENPYEVMLKKIQECIKPGGKILIAIENKMGLKYLNGAKEDHLSKPFIGIEDYRYTKGVRTFSRQELCQMFEKCGIKNYKFFYPMPDYKLPNTIYSDDILPHVGDIRTWGTNYDDIRLGLYNEGIFADQICRDKMFAYFCNSFFIVCNTTEIPVKYAHYTRTRIPELRTSTKIQKKGNGFVAVKEYLKDIPRKYDILVTMKDKYSILQEEFPAISYLEPTIQNGKLEYPYVSGIPLDEEIAKQIHNTEVFIAKLKNIVNVDLRPNENYLIDFELTDEYEDIFGNNLVKTSEKSLQVTNLDLILGNLIVRDKKIFCIDYEWVFSFPIPYEYVIYRCIEDFFSKFGMYFSQNIKKKTLLKEIGVKEENFEVYAKMQKHLYEFVHGEGQKYQYLNRYVKPHGMIKISI